MPQDCCSSFGGRITIDMDGDRISARGDVTIEPTNAETTAEANHDGSVYYTVRPRPFTFAATFSQPCGLRWTEKMARCRMNVTIVEEDNNRTHLFTGVRLVGRPSVNISTGEVSGLSGATDRYQIVANS